MVRIYLNHEDDKRLNDLRLSVMTPKEIQDHVILSESEVNRRVIFNFWSNKPIYNKNHDINYEVGENP